jgi:hypothetical protein
LVGFILAEQERVRNREVWKEYHSDPIKMETIIVVGISEKKNVVDTIDGGQGRSVGDVIFRNKDFGDVEEAQARLSNILAITARLVWLRAGGKLVSAAPHFPRSEALEFIENHQQLNEAVRFIYKLDGTGAEGKKISKRLSLGYAAGLLYLMATAKTKREAYDERGVEALDFSLWAKACEFWSKVAEPAGLAKDDPVYVLVMHILSKLDASGASARDELCGSIIKAWNLWVDGKPASAKELKVAKGKNERDKIVLVEEPRIGGIDVSIEAPEEEPVEEVGEEVEEAPRKGRKRVKVQKAEPALGKIDPRDRKGGKVVKQDPEEGVYCEGDKIWVEYPDGEHFFGEIVALSEDGLTAYVKTASGKEWQVPSETLCDKKPTSKPKAA